MVEVKDVYHGVSSDAVGTKLTIQSVLYQVKVCWELLVEVSLKELIAEDPLNQELSKELLWSFRCPL